MIKHITPDSPEFAEIAATIQQIEKIKPESFPRTVFYAEADKSKLYRRRETVDIL